MAAALAPPTPSRAALLALCGCGCNAAARDAAEWGDATPEEADAYDVDLGELPPGVVADLSAAAPASRVLLALNCGNSPRFQPGNTCGGQGYGRENGLRVSRVTKGNITAAGAQKTREFADKAGRKVEEHKTADGRVFHSVTHASGRRSFHSVQGPSKAAKARGAVGMGDRVTVTRGPDAGKTGRVVLDKGPGQHFGQYTVKFEDGKTAQFNDASPLSTEHPDKVRAEVHQREADSVRSQADTLEKLGRNEDAAYARQKADEFQAKADEAKSRLAGDGPAKAAKPKPVAAKAPPEVREAADGAKPAAGTAAHEESLRQSINAKIAANRPKDFTDEELSALDKNPRITETDADLAKQAARHENTLKAGGTHDDVQRARTGLRRVREEIDRRAELGGAAGPAAPDGPIPRYRLPDGTMVQVQSGRIIGGDARAVGLMGKRAADVGAVPEAEYHAKADAAKAAKTAAGVDVSKLPAGSKLTTESLAPVDIQSIFGNFKNPAGERTVIDPGPGRLSPEAISHLQSKGFVKEWRGEKWLGPRRDKAPTGGNATAPATAPLKPDEHQRQEAFKARQALARAAGKMGERTPAKASPAAAGAAYRNAVAAAGERDAARKAAGSQSRPVKSPAEMPAAQINAELDSLDKRASALGDKLVAAGRGHELPSITRQKSDPLAEEHKAIHDRADALRSEIERRYGKRVSRLPTGRGFGPTKKFSAAVTSRAALLLSCGPPRPAAVVLALSAADQRASPGAVIDPPPGMPATKGGQRLHYRKHRIAKARPFTHMVTGKREEITADRIGLWASAFDGFARDGTYPFIYPRHLRDGEQPDARDTLGYVVGHERDAAGDWYSIEQYVGDDAARVADANGRSVTIMADGIDTRENRYPQYLHHLALTPRAALPEAGYVPTLAASGAVVMAPVFVCDAGGCRPRPVPSRAALLAMSAAH